MQRSGSSRVFPFLITVIIIVLVVVAIVSLVRMLLGGNDTTSNENVATSSELLTVTADHGVRVTVRGPIVADEKFQSYTITATPSKRELVVYGGYLEDVDRRRTLENNTRAYEQLVYALDKAAMMAGTQPAEEQANDLRGICATGFVYEYAVLVDGETKKSLWTSTCSGSRGTLEASTRQLNNLFFEQIPDVEEQLPFGSSSSNLEF